MVRSFSFRLALAGVLLAAIGPLSLAAEKTPPAEDLDSARETVRQALVAETLGDNTQRARKLGEAILAAPDLDAANWHLARVKSGDKWLPLADAESQVAEDKTFVDYRNLRENATTPRLIQALANWCLKQRLNDLAELHFAQLLAHKDATPSMREEAIKRLDLVQVGGAWLRKEELEARQTEAKAVQEALLKWRPKLKAIQLVIDGPDFAKRDEAIAHLNQLDDPEMIPALESFVLDGKADFQEQAVKRLARFSHVEATEALVRYAIVSDYSLARDSAALALKQRPQHEFVPHLLAGLVAPIKSRYEIVMDGRGRIGYRHALYREGTSGNMLLLALGLGIPNRVERNTFVDKTVRVFAPEKAESKTTTTTSGMSAAEARRLQLHKAAGQAAATEANVASANAQIGVNNLRTFDALEKATGQQLPREPLQWWNWWQGYNEYHWPRPTLFAYQFKASTYTYGSSSYSERTGTRATSCFLAGTPVRTEAGLVPIESLQPGDRVLAQDQDTGELTYKLVLRTTLRPPAKMVRITAGSESITTTLGHPFWVSGHGWKMAKEFKAGDRLHSHGGAIEVTNIEPLEKPEPAHNLVVADFNTYFVGNQGLLVHDNEFRQPTRAVVPGLVLAE